MMQRTSVVLAALLGIACGLFEEETRDHWKHTSFGLPLQTVFHHRNAIVFTDANVLASVNMRQGSLSWRRHMPCTVTHMAASPLSLLTVCSDKHIFLWHASDGSLVWDLVLPHEGEVDDIGLLSVRDVEDAIIAVGGSAVCVRDEVIRWRWSPQQEGEYLERIVVNSKQGSIMGILSGSPSKSLFVDLTAFSKSKTADRASDEEDQQTTKTAARAKPQSSPFAVLEGSGVVVNSLSKDTVQMIKIADPHTQSTSLLQGEGSVVPKSHFTNSFLVASSGTQLLFGVSGSDVKLRRDILAEETVHPHAKTIGKDSVQTNLVAVTRTTISGSEVSIVGNSAADSAQFTLSTNITKIFINEFQRKDESWSWRALCVSQCGRVFAITAPTSPSSSVSEIWSSEQSLAHISNIKMVVFHPHSGVPTKTNTEDNVQFDRPTLLESAHVFTSFFSQLASEILTQAPDIVGSLYKEFESRLGRVLVEGPAVLFAPLPRRSTPNGAKGVNDGVVVCLCHGGHVFGLSFTTGEILWKIRSPIDFGVGATGHKGKLLEARKEGIYHGRLVVVMTEKEVSHMLWIEPASGEVIRALTTDVIAVDSFLLPITDSHHTHLLGLLDSSNKLRVFSVEGEVFPQIPELHHFLLHNSAPTTSPNTQHTTTTNEPTTNSVPSSASAAATTTSSKRHNTCCGVTCSCVVGLASTGGLTMHNTWLVSIPQGENVLAHAQQRKGLKVSSATRVTSDRKLLHKYINSNLLAVVTATPSVPQVTVYLIDSVSGRLLHHSIHPGCTGPAHVAITDNDVVVVMWNVEARANELVSLELFENRLEDSVVDALLGTIPVPRGLHNLTHYSSFNRPPPRVISRQYFLPKVVVSLTATETARGITSKQILAGLGSDQVWAIDRRFINPRQVSGTPTPEEREDQILQYSMIVPFSPLTVVSYNNTVLGLRGVVTEPGVFESESLMAAFGVDVLFVPLHPSGGFDQLSPDFNRAALLLAICGLAFALLLTVSAAKRKDLQRKWK